MVKVANFYKCKYNCRIRHKEGSFNSKLPFNYILSFPSRPVLLLPTEEDLD